VNLIDFANQVKSKDARDTTHNLFSDKPTKILYLARMKKEPLVFNPSTKPFTLGVELELQVLDGQSLLLTPRAHEIIDALGLETLKKEFFKSTLEVITGVCDDVHAVKNDLQFSLKKVQTKAHKLGLKIASTGTHPEADYRDRTITPSFRYNELADRNQWLIRRMAVYGMHIHVGMPSGDFAIEFNNFLLHFVPHVLALSASSPFWQRMDTGLAAARPTIYESMPTSGMPNVVKDWNQFQKLYNSLLYSNSIGSMKDLWWDIRPSPAIGTIELRICDEPATLDEALAIAAYVHMLALWFADHEDEWNERHKNVLQWKLRENKWRAIRYGLQGEIIVRGKNKSVAIIEDVKNWLEKLMPYVQQNQYAHYIRTINKMLDSGNSSSRQQQVYAKHNDLHEVTRFNVLEFEKGLIA
jgi:carboxylate-amine ligase